MKDPNNPCIFCNVNKSDIVHENELAYAGYDTYPVSKHHCLIVPKRHIQDYFELTNEELIACNNLIKIVKNEILKKDQSVDGFNLGTNIGKVSGQSIFHCVSVSVRDSAALLDATSGPELGAPYRSSHQEKKYLEVLNIEPGKLKIGYFLPDLMLFIQ